MSFSFTEASLLLGFIDIGPGEMVLLGIVAVLLFGKRLPEVGRSIGKGMAEFKRGLMGLGGDDQPKTGGFPGLSSLRSAANDDVDDYIAPSAPKFEPPVAEPTAPTPEVAPHSTAAPH